MNPPYGSEMTDRELEVFDLMSRGLSNVEIGRKLYLAQDTVKSHARRLFKRLGARDRAHAVRLGFELGVLVGDGEPDPLGIVGAEPGQVRAVARALLAAAHRQEATS